MCSEPFCASVSDLMRRECPSLLQLNKSAARGDRHGMRPIASAKFFHDALEVNLHCFFGDEELLPDIPIPISFRDLAQDVDLTVGERLLAEVLGQGGSDLRGNAPFPCMDLANRLRYLLRGHTFKQIGM